ncbi:MAG: tRNA 4-thiouridine(8) synthase ThiI [Bacilli bacterium]|nr:tRNA 4-thiouridine(8) synthase ThiI [Bacilli bacterium]
MYDRILIRFGEMTLKKDNYKYFLDRIIRDIENKLIDFKKLEYHHEMFRFYIILNGEDYNEIVKRLMWIPGIFSFSLCVKTGKDINDIANVGYELLKDKKGQYTFKVESHRGDKNYPLTSIEISKKVSALILPKLRDVVVDVHNPDVELNIDLRVDGTYIFTDVIKGIGGYPAGIAGKGLVMMSGGLDSPVATYLSIKKGINVSAIHFYSPPFTSINSLQKVIDLLHELAKYTYKNHIKLYVVPFTTIQEKIYKNANNIYLVTLMRRAMYRIADKVVRKHYLDCIINGESVGQVASQTLESMKVVNEVTNLPILRPLATFDKEEIVTISSKINTYDISIRPYEDCCTVFVPKHPTIKPVLNDVLLEEDKCNFTIELDEAVKNITEYDISYGKRINLFEEENDDIYNL